ncbi:hypothetical protein Hanom_Chr11g01028801 [Helianthus anomalus]
MDVTRPAWERCNIIMAMIFNSPLAYDLTAHIWIYPDILQEFWLNVRLMLHKGRLTTIGSWVMERPNVLNEYSIREVLHLYDHNNVLTFTHQELNNTLI